MLTVRLSETVSDITRRWEEFFLFDSIRIFMTEHNGNVNTTGWYDSIRFDPIAALIEMLRMVIQSGFLLQLTIAWYKRTLFNQKTTICNFILWLSA